MTKIKVDHTKCNNAFNCLKCLDICMAGVFLVLTEGHPFVKDALGKINPAFMTLCSGCGDCVKGCPVKAITIN